MIRTARLVFYTLMCHFLLDLGLTTSPKTNCPNPSLPPLPYDQVGNWTCQYNEDNEQECHLVCPPGRIAFPISYIKCLGRTWSPQPPDTIECDRSVAFIVGGQGSTSTSAEVYGPSILGECSFELTDELPFMITDQRILGWANGVLVVCDWSVCYYYTNDRWNVMNNLTTGMLGTGSDVLLSSLYAVGGYGVAEHGPLDLTQILPVFTQSSNWILGTAMPIAKNHHCVVGINAPVYIGGTVDAVLGPSIVIIGGVYGSSSSFLRSVDVLDITTGAWSKHTLPPLHYLRSDAACGFVSKNGISGILVAGGYNGTQMNTAEFLNFNTGRWVVSTLTDSYPLSDATMTIVDGALPLLMGGVGSGDSRSIQEYHPWKNSWHYLEYFDVKAQLIRLRSNHAATAIPSKFFDHCKLDNI